MRLFLSALCFVAITTTIAASTPAFVTVGYNTHVDDVLSAENIRVVEMIGNTVFLTPTAEEIAILESNGISPRVLLEDIHTVELFIAETVTARPVELPGDVIWRENDVSIVNIPSHRRHLLYSEALLITPLTMKQRTIRDMIPPPHKEKTVVDLQWDPSIQVFVDAVSTDSISAYIQTLQDFRSRLALGESSFAASEWIRDTYESWGYEARFDTFWMQGAYGGIWPGSGYERNVIATSTGQISPEKTFIICGHFDSIVWSDTALARENAPGADDNATGTVAAMEAARVFVDQEWDSTMEFIGWGAEELGLFGSYHYADVAENSERNIAGVVNLDMVGYRDDAAFDCDIQIKDGRSRWLSDLYIRAGALYTPSLTIVERISSGGSDWYPFALAGYPAVGAAERAGSFFNPYYHSTSDRIETLDPDLYTSIIKASVATMAILGTYPGSVEDVVVRDAGNGTDLIIEWSVHGDEDVDSYRVRYGIESGTYTETIEVPGRETTTLTMGNLIAGEEYYFIVQAVDEDGHMSFQAEEIIGVPRLIPTPPMNLVAEPLSFAIVLDWETSQELDVAGYNIYRRLNDLEQIERLNENPLPVPGYIDEQLSGENRYYYAVSAVDDQGNESQLSPETFGRPITLDQGILLVDETRNHTSLPDSVQDAFYSSVLSGFTVEEYEFGDENQRPLLSHFGPYSTIFWHADDFAEFLASPVLGDLSDYFEEGGNIIIAGWKPTLNFTGETGYPIMHQSGEFHHDIVGLDHTHGTPTSETIREAAGHGNLPDLIPDPDKIPVPGWGETLRYFEAFTPGSSTEVLYTLITDDTDQHHGMPCGVRRFSDDAGVVYLGFPLYYLDSDSVEVMLEEVLTSLGETPPVHSIPEPVALTGHIRLEHPVPNPLTDHTSIRFYLPFETQIDLGVYDLAGRLVHTIKAGDVEPGSHDIRWDGTNDRGARQSSGVYLLRLRHSGGTLTRKLVLMR